MKTYKLTITGIIAGLIFTIGSIVKYWIVNPDYDKAIAYVGIGLLIIFTSWIFEMARKNKKEIEILNEFEGYVTDKFKEIENAKSKS